MAPALTALLQAAASTVLGDRLKGLAVEKVTQVARRTLKLPEDAPEADIDAALAADPEAYAVALAEITDWRIEQEQTWQTAVAEMEATARTRAASDDPFVRRARPFLMYLFGSICAVMVGGIIWVALDDPVALPGMADAIAAAMVPLGLLGTACGIYSRSRTTDKAIAAGLTLPPIFGSNN